MRNKEEKEKTYKEIDKVIRANTSKGPVVTAGDFNARIQKATNSEERKIIGQWTFEPETARVHGRVEGVMENRNLLIEHCTSHNLTICNTWFKKPKCKTVTFKEIGTTMEDEYARGKHEQLDFITIQHRWKNLVTNAESDTTANIHTDHYPVWIKFRMKLKAETTKKHKQRDKYDKCTEEQRGTTNDTMSNSLKRNRHKWESKPYEGKAETAHKSCRRLKEALEEAADTLPKMPKKKRKVAFSKTTEQILQERQEAIEQRNSQSYEVLTSKFRKTSNKIKET